MLRTSAEELLSTSNGPKTLKGRAETLPYPLIGHLNTQ